MIYAFPYQEKENHPKIFDDMFRERHRLYVEGRGWKELGRGDGREIDEFDTSCTIYLLSLSSNGALQGGIRLNPSTNPHLLDTIFPELCSAHEVPRGVAVWEMSRLFVCHHSEIDEQGVNIKGKLFTAMLEFCVLHDITTVSAVCDSYFLPRVLKAGVKAKPLGLPQKYESGEMVAVSMNVDNETVENVQRHYKVPPNSFSGFCSGNKGGDRPMPSRTPGGQDEISALINLDMENALLQQTGVVGGREELVEQFSNLVIRLGSGNAKEVKLAEEELDRLTEQVRQELYGGAIEGKRVSSRLQ